MRIGVVGIAVVASLSLAGCGAEPSKTAETTAEAEAGDIERPEDAPVVGVNDNLVSLTCANFLDTAAVATDEEDEEAAIAAQDEIAAGLIWIHGYLFAKNDGEIGVLSQTWMEETAGRIYGTCSEAEDPNTLNLFEVVLDESA
ncbi:MAG: hypothetical protein AAFW59_00765 [Pseudomonadota bacterium]